MPPVTFDKAGNISEAVVPVEWGEVPFPVIVRPYAVHVWRLELGVGPRDLAQCESLLSQPELQRAARFKLVKARQAFVAARAGLRAILAHYLGIPADSLRFGHGVHGKPFLLGNEKLHFNLAHSGALALVAVTVEREVGIDIETLRPIDGADKIVEEFFSPAECREYRASAILARGFTFLRIWTRKEAMLKASGTGFSQELSGVDLDEATSRWTIVSFVPEPGYVASAAIVGEASQLLFLSTASIPNFLSIGAEADRGNRFLDGISRLT